MECFFTCCTLSVGPLFPGHYNKGKKNMQQGITQRQLQLVGSLQGKSFLKGKTSQQPTAPAAQPGALGSTTPSSPISQVTFADVVAGHTTPVQSVPLLVSHIQKL